MSTRPSRARLVSHSVAAHHPHPLHLPEIMFWSILGWIYWMALMVLLVWAVAQAMVGLTLYREPALETRLQEYASIGTRWKPLSDVGDAAEGVSAMLEPVKTSASWGAISKAISTGGLASFITIEVIEETLNLLSYAGKEFRALSDLDQVVQATQAFRTDPSRANLQALMATYTTGAATLTQVQADLDKFVESVAPVVQVGGSTTRAFAGVTRAYLVQADPGFEAEVTAFVDQLEDLSASAVDFMDDAEKYSGQIAEDAQMLRSMQHTIAVADLRESIVTYFIFRDFIKWFMTHVWTIDGVLVIVIALRVGFGYRRLFFPTAHTVHTSPGMISPTTV